MKSNIIKFIIGLVIVGILIFNVIPITYRTQTIEICTICGTKKQTISHTFGKEEIIIENSPLNNWIKKNLNESHTHNFKFLGTTVYTTTGSFTDGGRAPKIYSFRSYQEMMVEAYSKDEMISFYQNMKNLNEDQKESFLDTQSKLVMNKWNEIK